MEVRVYELWEWLALLLGVLENEETTLDAGPVMEPGG